MRQTIAKTQFVVLCVFAAASLGGQGGRDPQQLTIEAAQATISQYEKLELLIRLDAQFQNPFDLE